ncbi:MAG: hypothetical protein U0Z17_05945 [Bacteroidales bacterium]
MYSLQGKLLLLKNLENTTETLDISAYGKRNPTCVSKEKPEAGSGSGGGVGNIHNLQAITVLACGLLKK